MIQKMFAYVGNWNRTGEGGIGIYRYNPDSGALRLLKVVREDIAAGSILLDEKRGVLYIADEKEESPEYCPAAGGRIFAMKIDSVTGNLRELNHFSSCGILPAGLTWDGTGEGILVCNHSNDACVYHIEQTDSGEIIRTKVFNDASLVHYAVGSDGSLCDADAFFAPPQQSEAAPCLHSVNLAPDGKTLILCERNQNIVYRLVYDQEKKQLSVTDALQLDQSKENSAEDGDTVRLSSEKGTASPRYSVFHPHLPLVYINSESLPQLYLLRYEGKRMELVGTYDVTPSSAGDKAFFQSDLCISADGKYLYNLYRGINTVCVHRLDEKTGEPVMIQEVLLEGIGPRGCSLSPDGRFLLVMNLDSGDITSLAVEGDGTLNPSGIRLAGQKRPCNIRFYPCS